MSKRIDYYDDPEAPAANSMVPSVNVVIENDAGEILMIRRSDNGNWAPTPSTSSSTPATAKPDRSSRSYYALGQPAAPRRRAAKAPKSDGYLQRKSELCRWTAPCADGSTTTAIAGNRRTSTKPTLHVASRDPHDHSGTASPSTSAGMSQ